MPLVSWKRPELVRMSSRYARIRDCIEGEAAVKGKTTKYLPVPDPSDVQSAFAINRYAAYLERAVFYNVTGRTVRGMAGQIFNRPPEITVPSVLQPMMDDVDGIGVSMVQQVKGSVADGIAIGRGGLLSDFPTVENGVTQAQLLSGEVKPTITKYAGEEIINWRFEKDGSRRVLTLVVLEEKREVFKPNDFASTVKKQWRVLRLDESGHYVQELYFDDKSERQEYYTPQYADGVRFGYLPFEVFGSEDNDPSIDPPPTIDLANINIAHFRNSADWEESVFMVGQPTPYVAGLNEEWVKNVLKGEIFLGSRAAIMLPPGGSAGLIQAQPNNIVQAAMDQKERQMVALGAKLVEQREVQRTATEASQEEAAEGSQLSNIADNVSSAYENAIRSCQRFISRDEAKIKFKLNTIFELSTMDANTRAQVVKEWQQGATSFSEMRAQLRRAGAATLPDAQAITAIASEEALRGGMLEEQRTDVREPNDDA